MATLTKRPPDRHRGRYPNRKTIPQVATPRKQSASLSRGRGHAQARGQDGGGGERARDPGDAGGPSEAIEQLAKHRAADHAAEEIARQIKAARDAAFAC